VEGAFDGDADWAAIGVPIRPFRVSRTGPGLAAVSGDSGRRAPPADSAASRDGSHATAAAPPEREAEASRGRRAPEVAPASHPDEISLGVHPNPFRAETWIEYALPERAAVTIGIYNVRGQEVRRLVHRHEPSGFHRARWDGRSDSGAALGSGLYFVRVQLENRVLTRRLVLRH
jgi:hypothetical protein